MHAQRKADRGEPQRLSQDERRNRRAAIVSQTATRQCWPGGSSIGCIVQLVPDAGTCPPAPVRRHPAVEIIGVARDTATDIDNDGPVRP
jgi:hypothetical protein